MHKRSPIHAAILAALLCVPAAVAGEPVSADQAREIAFAQTGGGQILNSGRHYRGNGMYVYRFEIVGSDGAYHVEVEEGTGKLLKFIRKGGYHGGRKGRGPYGQDAMTPSQPPPSRGTPSGGMISQEQALAIALGKTGGGTVLKYELDRDDGRFVHEMKIANEGMRYEVEIDDASGAILEFSLD